MWLTLCDIQWKWWLRDYEVVTKLLYMLQAIWLAEKGHNHIYHIIIYSWHNVTLIKIQYLISFIEWFNKFYIYQVTFFWNIICKVMHTCTAINISVKLFLSVLELCFVLLIKFIKAQLSKDIIIVKLTNLSRN